jgi:phospholipase/carboxylesterase
VELQEALFALGRSLRGVITGRSLVSLPGARAFFLDPSLARGPEAAFQAGTEFAHIHAPFDGSLHVTLPESVVHQVMSRGWGEPHPVQKGLLIYGPRDEQELAVAWQLLQISHTFACGTWSASEE